MSWHRLHFGLVPIGTAIKLDLSPVTLCPFFVAQSKAAMELLKEYPEITPDGEVDPDRQGLIHEGDHVLNWYEQALRNTLLSVLYFSFFGKGLKSLCFGRQVSRPRHP